MPSCDVQDKRRRSSPDTARFGYKLQPLAAPLRERARAVTQGR